jgi:hypothetical protein
MAKFQELMSLWKAQNMMNSIVACHGASAEGYSYREYQDFSILPNHSRLAQLTGGRHGIVTGRYSDDLERLEKVSEYSADSTQAL